MPTKPTNYETATGYLSAYRESVERMTPETAEPEAFALSVAMQAAQVHALLAVADALCEKHGGQ